MRGSARAEGRTDHLATWFATAPLPPSDPDAAQALYSAFRRKSERRTNKRDEYLCVSTAGEPDSILKRV